MKKSNRKPRVLFYDVESTPIEAYSWPGRMYDQQLIKVKKDWELLSVSWRWQGQKQTHCITREGKKDDKRVVDKIFNLLSKADLIVAHNGDKSDYRKIKTRFAYYKMGLPKLSSSVDTLKVVREHYLLNSYSLENVCEFFGLGRKLKHAGFDLWLDCIANKPKAWRQMVRYNKHDSVILERLYEYLRRQGHITNHPTLQRIIDPGLVAKKGVCPQCGSTHVHKRGFRATQARLYRQWQCQEKTCNAWFNTGVTKTDVKGK